MAEIILDPQEDPRRERERGLRTIGGAAAGPAGFFAGAVRAFTGGGGSNVPFPVGVDLETGNIRIVYPSAIQKILDKGEIPRAARGAPNPTVVYAQNVLPKLEAVFNGESANLKVGSVSYERYRNDLVVLGQQYRQSLAPRPHDVPTPPFNEPDILPPPPDVEPPRDFGPGDIPFPHVDPLQGEAGGIFIPVGLPTMPNPYMPFSGLAAPRSGIAPKRRRKATKRAAPRARRKARGKKGGRFVKGSAAAKRYMAKLRRMRK